MDNLKLNNYDFFTNNNIKCEVKKGDVLSEKKAKAVDVLCFGKKAETNNDIFASFKDDGFMIG